MIVDTRLPFRLAIVAESENACCNRLHGAGFDRDRASEIAVYLGQATDLPGFLPGIAAALAPAGVAVEAVDVDHASARLASWLASPTVVWVMTDGLAYYRGSPVTALARLVGLPVYGSGAQAQHLCQDKFASGMLARSAGLRTPPTALYEGSRFLAGDRLQATAGPFFVKPNRLGAKIGIFADSLAPDFTAAMELCRRIEARYCDRAVVQPFVPGSDVRVSFMDLGGPLPPQLGIARLARDPRSETGGAFMTMRDNETLSSARDTEGGTGGFSAGRTLAFTPRMDDLRRSTSGADAALVAEIEAMADALARLVGLRDYFSMDIRVDEDGVPWFLEFETCPAVTIYDFQTYLRERSGLSLGEALLASLRRVPERKDEI
ncbi:D-alanine--D-alanine ligase family protein [Alsobacter sp. R-9]